MAGPDRVEPYGPPVPDSEDFYRAVIYPHWWHNDRPNSAAFDDSPFSVDLVSRTSSVSQTLARFPSGTGLVRLNCGVARGIGFDTRDEPDERSPENGAHAHVYDTGIEPSRKERAKKLALNASVVVPPDLQRLDDRTKR